MKICKKDILKKKKKLFKKLKKYCKEYRKVLKQKLNRTMIIALCLLVLFNFLAVYLLILVIIHNFPIKQEINVPQRIWQVQWTGYYTISAYNSEVGQTDSTPCITANGFNLCQHGIEDSVAANFLRFGTHIRIPELFGSRIFVVRDRMNARYPYRVDVWLKNKQMAKKFGVRVGKVEILE